MGEAGLDDFVAPSIVGVAKGVLIDMLLQAAALILLAALAWSCCFQLATGPGDYNF